ncbi:MAG: SPOR domain-containing protein [Bacteroidales bacterium]|nr:SPOR domain-containing protein [Bacteroidales bacterium]
MPKPIVFLSVAILFMLSQALSGQTQSFKADQSYTYDWQFNYHLGFTQFYGDASNNGYFKKLSGESGFGTGVTARKSLSSNFAVGATFLYSKLKSHKIKSAIGSAVDFTLSGNYTDGSVHLYVDLSNLFWGEANRKFNVYTTIGLGFASWNTQLADNLSGQVIISGDTVNGITTKKSGAVIPVGLGINYLLGNNWALNFEGNLRSVMNDDVDMWADGFKFDQPFYTQIGISYYFNAGGSKKERKVRGERPRKSNQPKPYQKNTDQIPLYDYTKQPIKPATKAVPKVESEFTENKPVTPVVNQYGLVYRVQILAKNQALRSVTGLKQQFGLNTEVFENYQDGVYRYSVGSFTTYRQALSYAQELKQKGIADAFVVVYQNNKRVKLTDDLKK